MIPSEYYGPDPDYWKSEDTIYRIYQSGITGRFGDLSQIKFDKTYRSTLFWCHSDWTTNSLLPMQRPDGSLPKTVDDLKNIVPNIISQTFLINFNHIYDEGMELFGAIGSLIYNPDQTALECLAEFTSALQGV